MTPSQSGKWADLGLRTLTALILIPVVLLAVWAGGLWFQLLATAMGILMAREWSAIANKGDQTQFLLQTGAAIVAGFMPGHAGVMAIVGVLAGVALGANLFLQNGAGPKTGWARLGVLYVSLPVLAVVMLRGDAALGATAIIWILFVVWLADIMAYFSGRLIGGPKLAPRLSPKKTWAGLAGAMGGAALAAIAVDVIALHTNLWPLVLLAGLFALLEQAGDIFESALKRAHGVKDSGTLFPGHGGMIDRVDGLVAVAVVAWVIGTLRNPVSPAAGLLIW
jgi:phosphatidate cytidylyltransferase